LDFLIRRTETGYEIESQVDETKLEDAVTKIEDIRMQIIRLDHDLAPKRKVLELSAECENHWIKQNDGVRKLNPTIPASYRVALSMVDGGNIGKRIAELVDETQLSHPHVQYHLTRASGSSEWYSQDVYKIWTLTDAGIERIRRTILPYLQGRHDNEMSRILKWIDKRILANQLEEWLLKKKTGKVDKTDVLEYSVGLLLSTLGFLVYQVGMYNDHFDIVAYAEDGARVLLCDCTRGTVRKKASTLGNSVEDFRKEFPKLSAEGIVFTTERISKTDRKDLLKDGIRIADISQIKDLYKISMTNRNPELLFDAIQNKEP
jgi:DNA-binding transcriptional ArsR family regulator